MKHLWLSISTALLATALLATALSSCRPETPRVVSAEFIEREDGHGYKEITDPILRVTLDRAVRASSVPERIALKTSPTIDFAAERVESTGEPVRILDFRVLRGAAAIRTDGRFGEGDAMGLGVDLGAGTQWVDIQPRRVHPRFDRAVWEDVDGDLVVSEGDLIHLLFDRPVRIDESAPAGVRVRVPEDIILGIGDDALDNGKTPSTFRGSKHPNDILIVLGSRPRLVLSHHDSPAFRSEVSSIALNSTSVQPMRKLVGVKGGRGAISTRGVPIELPRSFPGPVREEERFPQPHPEARILQSATPFPGFPGRGVAILAGGESRQGVNFETIDQVLAFRPELTPGSRLDVVGALKTPRILHTATHVTGTTPLTDDDATVIIGGLSSGRSLNSLEAVRFDGRNAQFVVEPLDQRLRLPRSYHTATFVPPNQILVIGGLLQEPGAGDAVISTAELLTFNRGLDGRVYVKDTPRDRPEARLLPRMRHTATSLGWIREGVWGVLVYGGIGRDPIRDAGAPVSSDVVSRGDTAVLAAPELVEIDVAALDHRGEATSGRPIRSTILWAPTDFTQLRYDHRAVLVGDARGRLERTRVVISGGSLRPLDSDRAHTRPRREKWQMSGAAAAFDTNPPSGNECANILVFELDPEDAESSGLWSLRSSHDEPRVFHESVWVPGRGVFIFGGEHPDVAAQKVRTIELYDPDDGPQGSVHPTALSFLSPRSVFASCVLGTEGYRSLYVFGGLGSEEDAGTLAAVEAIRLE